MRGRKPSFGSGHSEFVEAVVVDSKVVADLVEDGDAHLLSDLVVGVADGLDVVLVDADPVGEHEVVVLTACGEGDTVVEAEEQVAMLDA